MRSGYRRSWIWIVAGLLAILMFAAPGGWLGVGIVAVAVVALFALERQRLNAKRPTTPDKDVEAET